MRASEPGRRRLRGRGVACHRHVRCGPPPPGLRARAVEYTRPGELVAAGRRAECAARPLARHRPPSELQPHQISRPGLRAVAGSIVVAEPPPLACRVGSRRLRCVSPSSWWVVADRRLTCAWQCGGSDVLLPIGCIIVRYNTSSCVQERRSRARRHCVVLWDVVVYMYWVVRIVCRRITYHVKHTPPSVQR